jgi:hypothetical protein
MVNVDTLLLSQAELPQYPSGDINWETASAPHAECACVSLVSETNSLQTIYEASHYRETEFVLLIEGSGGLAANT